jgi:hypothetical protein
MTMLRRTILALLVTVVMVTPLAAQATASQLANAIGVVAKQIDPSNKATISRADLAAIQNPKGDGVVVYAKQGRSAVWVVLGATPYALNAPAKLVTPNAAWSRDAPESIWKPTNLSPFNAAGELLKIVRPGE